MPLLRMDNSQLRLYSLLDKAESNGKVLNLLQLGVCFLRWKFDVTSI